MRLTPPPPHFSPKNAPSATPDPFSQHFMPSDDSRMIFNIGNERYEQNEPQATFQVAAECEL